MATRLSIVIPVYNAAATIGPLVDQLVADLAPQYALEIVLVHDCSPAGGTEAACLAAHQRHPHLVKFYSLAKNVGEHNAVMAGLRHTTGAYVVIMDDDFQNPIAEVAKLVAEAERSHADVVYTYYAAKQHAWWRNLGSRFNGAVAGLMLRKPAGLYLSSFKLLTRFLVDEIVKYDFPFPYLDGLVLRTTSNIAAIQVAHVARAQGRSGYTLRKLVRLWLNMFTNFSMLPLRVATGLGFLISLLGIGLALYTLYERLTSPTLPPGWALLTIVICLFSGAQLVCIGTVGEYVGRLFLGMNQQPQYTIRRAYEQERGHAAE
jgi:undecaprenyl-phosphate 4-deoxy-4-formamido-L-arabinose transferase